MPFDSHQPEKVPDSVIAPSDPFRDSIQSVSRQNSLPFWLDRSWIPAESEYPTDDEDGRGLFGIRHSSPRVLVYDWEQKTLQIRPLDTYKYPNSSDSTYRFSASSNLGRGRRAFITPEGAWSTLIVLVTHTDQSFQMRNCSSQKYPFVPGQNP